jgi:hypothetical protein
MSVKSVITQLWAPLTISAISTVAVGFAINLLTADNPRGWGWWVLLAAGIVGIVIGGLWAYRLQSSREQPVAAGGARPVAPGPEVNVSMTADDHSAVAWHMGSVNIGSSPDRDPHRK